MKTRRRRKDGNTVESSDSINVSAAAPTGTKPFDPDRYRGHIAHLGLARDAEDELIHSIRCALESFIARAWGDDPVQLLGTSVDRLPPNDGRRSRRVIDSSGSTTNTNSTRLSSAFTSPAAGRRRKETQ